MHYSLFRTKMKGALTRNRDVAYLDLQVVELRIYFETHFRIYILGVQKFDRIIQVSRTIILTVVARADTYATSESGTDKKSKRIYSKKKESEVQKSKRDDLMHKLFKFYRKANSITYRVTQKLVCLVMLSTQKYFYFESSYTSE